MGFQPENQKEMPKEEIVISTTERLEKIKREMAEAGPEKLHVLTDFDNTLTKAFVDGKKVTSLIAILRDGDYLTPDYREKAQTLADKYMPMEKDPNLSLEEKKKAMQEWWKTHFDLLIRSGLNKRDLEKVAESSNIQLREGTVEFIDFLREKNIPLVIMSASGLGEAIFMSLQKHGRLYDNIHIITNSYEWDKNGKAIGVKKPIIHALNKDETLVKDFPSIFGKIKDRKNVLLLGDGLNDIGMVEGFDYENLIKIGFLNEETDKNLESYRKNFDVVLTNDASMDYVNGLMKETAV